MDKVSVSLKAKHFRLITYVLKYIVASDVFDVLAEIKNKVPDTADDEDVIEIQVVPEKLVYIYPILSEKSEGLVSEINKEMDYMLRPQMEAGLSENDDNWIFIATSIQALKTRNAIMLHSHIDEGKRFLNT